MKQIHHCPINKLRFVLLILFCTVGLNAYFVNENMPGETFFCETRDTFLHTNTFYLNNNFY